MTSFLSILDKLADSSPYGDAGVPVERWGQLLRELPDLRHLMDDLEASGRAKRLWAMATLRGGAVTRANDFFLLRELKPEDYPEGITLTVRDRDRLSVYQDGLGVAHVIEREFAAPAIKAKESPASPTSLNATDLHLLVVDSSRETLRQERKNHVLRYLTRGETVSYNKSADKLKGGIPALRSNIRNRKPYWYSLSAPPQQVDRILLPEHIGDRYFATLLSAGTRGVVIDKLFVAIANDPAAGRAIHIGLNSLLAWYQVELRGRTSLGDGALELKKPDWGGILLPDFGAITSDDWAELENLFAAIPAEAFVSVDEALRSDERAAFDEKLLGLLGVKEPEEVRLDLARGIKYSIAERRLRTDSVHDQKQGRGKREALASAEAFVSRIAGALSPCPDPRNYVVAGTHTMNIPILDTADGRLSVGDQLMDHSVVYSGGNPIAEAPGPEGALFVMGALLHDRGLESVDVPLDPEMQQVLRAWETARALWFEGFEQTTSAVLEGIADERVQEAIKLGALSQLCAL